MTNNQQPPVLESQAAAPQQQRPARQSPPPYDDEIDLLELWRALMRGKWIIIAFTAVFSVASVFYALSLPNMYRSTAVLAPAESARSQGLGRLAGLASLAGVSLGGAGSSKTTEALEILQSWAFIEEFIQEQNIAPQVFAVKGWNPEANELIYDTETYDPQTQTWTRESLEGKQAEPSSWELYEVFSQMVSAGKNDKTGFYSLSVESHSPYNSKAWVDALLVKINRDFKRKDRQEAERNIEFLRKQAASTDLSGMQSVFYNLIEDQTKALMLASGSDAYVFRVISESRVSEKKSAPSRSVICIVSALLGGVLGVFVSLVRYKVKTRSLYNG